MASAFLLDMSRCIGCEACVVACKAGNELPEGRQYIELIEQTTGTFPDLTGGFQNHRCYHCSDATCVAVCPTGALQFKVEAVLKTSLPVCQSLSGQRGLACQQCLADSVIYLVGTGVIEVFAFEKNLRATGLF